MQFPAVPDIPKEHRADGVVFLRYEDISQEGRVMLTSLPQATGMVIWRKVLTDHPITQSRNREGIVPILARMVIEGGGGPVSVMRQIECEGGVQLGHTVDDDGDVNRLMMNIYANLTGTIGRTAGPHPPNHGQRVAVGRVAVEHVFTRPHAPPEQRKVLELPMQPPIPPDRCTWTRPEDNLVLPEGAEPLDDELTPDDAGLAFGLAHTDSNQHVNSLIYPRLFEEAALRRIAKLGLSTKVLSRFASVSYRKPCFAGDHMRFPLRAFKLDDRIGVLGSLVPDDDRDGRPHTFIQMYFAE